MADNSVIRSSSPNLVINKNDGDKELFVQSIKKWVVADTQLKSLNERVRLVREFKHKLTENICNYVHENNINQTIEISDGELKIYEKKEYSSLTYSYLEDCLEKIIQNREHIDYILQYIKDNREIESSYEIRRNTNK
jgi:hypothetical protein